MANVYHLRIPTDWARNEPSEFPVALSAEEPSDQMRKLFQSIKGNLTIE